VPSWENIELGGIHTVDTERSTGGSFAVVPASTAEVSNYDGLIAALEQASPIQITLKANLASVSTTPISIPANKDVTLIGNSQDLRNDNANLTDCFILVPNTAVLRLQSIQVKQSSDVVTEGVVGVRVAAGGTFLWKPAATLRTL
jgi:hypothetical protein